MKLFARTPVGQKTDRMREVEAQLGRSLEDDYREFYLEKKLGQTRLAHRWGVRRNLIFHPNPRSRGRSWVQILGLPRREPDGTPGEVKSSRRVCESCGDGSVSLERAHWVEACNGGSTSHDNIVLLCPNCHTKLDREKNPALAEKVRAILLWRAAQTILSRKGCAPDEFLLVCTRIIHARK